MPTIDYPTNILLIEDQPPDIRLIQEYLKETPIQPNCFFHSETLAGGREILASDQDIDIVLLDLHLPDSLGYNTFDQLFQEFSNIPFIVLTGLSDESVGLQAVKKGAQDFLNKNDLNPQTLSKSIRYGIERHQMLMRLENAQKLAKIGNFELILDSDTEQSDKIYSDKKDTHELYCSQEVNTIFGKERSFSFDSINAYLGAVYEEDRELVEGFFRNTYEKNGVLRIDHRVLLESGEMKYIVLQGQTETDKVDKLQRLVGTIQDISERKQFEELIRKKELAEQKARLKQDFLQNTSHEIRTPLNAILRLTDFLLKEESRPQQRKDLNLIATAGNTLLAVVNDVLDLSKIEANKMDFARSNFSLSQVVDSVIKLMDFKAKENNLEILTKIDPNLPDVWIGDSVRLNQILINLINNAIKFTDKGFVKISVNELERKGNQARLAFFVEDTGIGIPEDKLSTIFESFGQVKDTSQRNYKGTGLGLTIVEQLIKLQGGEISVASEVGKGSVFSFVLPLEVGDPKALETTDGGVEVDSRQLEGLNILVVEDNEMNQLVTKRILADWGVTVDIAHNGEEGIQRLKDHSYHLVLMDIQMPKMDGYQATTHIRSQMSEPARGIPIIALTANAFNGMDDECLKVGMNDYLSKPFKPNNLYAKIVQNLKMDDKGMPVLHRTLTTNQLENNPAIMIETDQNLNGASTERFTDLSYLQEVCGGDNMIINSAIAKFLETTPVILQGMDESLANGEYLDLSRHAHKLKSSVATLGISKIKDTVENIEHQAKNLVSLEMLPEMVSTTREIVEKAFSELNSILEKA